MPDNTPKSFVADASQAVPKSFVADVQPGVSAEGKPAFSPGTYQLRKGGPILDPAKSPLRTGAEAFGESFGVHNPTGVGDALKQAGTAFAGGAAKAAAEPFSNTSMQDPLMPLKAPLDAALVVPNMVARGVEGIASGIEGGSKDIGLGASRGDWRSMAAGIGQLSGTLGQMEAPEHISRAFKTAASLIERQPTVEQGKIGYVNAARDAATKLDNAVRTQGVGVRVQRVVDADKLDLARSSSDGKVDTTQAVLNAAKVFEKTKMGSVPGGYPAKMTMDAAKATMTQLGREASRLERGGKAPEADAVWAEYDGLREATQKRAVELGMGREWSDYSQEFRNYLGLHSGLLGHIVEGEHTATLNQIISHSGQMPELHKWFDKYHVDMSPVRDAAVEGKKLNELTQVSSSALMGKIKLLSRHWALGLPALAGAHLGAEALGLSGGIGGFILPLIIAGKVGGLLDTMQVKSLLYDLQRKLPPEQFNVSGAPVGPLETLHNAASQPAAPAGGGSPLQGALNTMDEQLKPWPQRLGEQRVSLQKVIDDPQASAADKQAADNEMRKLGGQRVKDTGPAEGQPERRNPSKADQAKQVEAARGSRAQSGVYKGKRSGK